MGLATYPDRRRSIRRWLTIWVSVATPQAKGGISFKFSAWSDGKARPTSWSFPVRQDVHRPIHGPTPGKQGAGCGDQDERCLRDRAIHGSVQRGGLDYPDGDSLSYRWDLDGDGAYDDSTASKPSRTFADPGAHRVRLKVTDGRGGVDTAQVTIVAGPQPVGASFTDVPVGYVFYEDIEWLLAEGVTEGCATRGRCSFHRVGDEGSDGGVPCGYLVSPPWFWRLVC